MKKIYKWLVFFLLTLIVLILFNHEPLKAVLLSLAITLELQSILYGYLVIKKKRAMVLGRPSLVAVRLKKLPVLDGLSATIYGLLMLLGGIYFLLISLEHIFTQ